MRTTPSRQPSASDKGLLEACRAGDERALETLFREHSGRLYASSCAMVGPEEAEDLVQQTFIVAYRKLSAFRGDSKISTWLHGIALRLAANRRRAAQRRSRLRASVKAGMQERRHTDPESQIAARLALLRVEGHLERLRPTQRMAFLLHAGEGKDLSEVAEMMGASVQTTHARIKAARQRLLELLQSEPPGGER